MGQMLQVAISDLKLIGTVPVVMNDAGNELISVLGPKCMQHNGCSQELSSCNPIWPVHPSHEV